MGQAHIGVGLGNSARVGSCIFAPSGTTFAGADAVAFGDRKDATLKLGKKLVSNFAGQGRQYAHMATVTYNSLEGTYQRLRDAYLLTKRFAICKFTESTTGYNYYFIDDPTPASPTGSTTLGVKFTYTHTLNDVVLSIIGQGQLSPGELSFATSHVSSTITGDTSAGASVGLSGSGYAVANFIPGNFRTMYITNGTGSGYTGTLKNMTFTLESFSDIDTDDRDRFIHNKYRYTLKGTCIAAEPTELEAYNTDVQTDTTLLATDAVGRQILINNARLQFDFETGDKTRGIDFECVGECNRNPNEGTPTSIDIGVTDSNILALSTLGLN